MPYFAKMPAKSHISQTPEIPCKIREATSEVSRYACIIGHFATAATEKIVEVGHSGAKQGETKL